MHLMERTPVPRTAGCPSSRQDVDTREVCTTGKGQSQCDSGRESDPAFRSHVPANPVGQQPGTLQSHTDEGYTQTYSTMQMSIDCSACRTAALVARRPCCWATPVHASAPSTSYSPAAPAPQRPQRQHRLVARAAAVAEAPAGLDVSTVRVHRRGPTPLPPHSAAEDAASSGELQVSDTSSVLSILRLNRFDRRWSLLRTGC